MTKSKKIIAAVLGVMLGAQTVLVTGCGSNEERFEMVDTDKEIVTYDNADFSDFSADGVKNTDLFPDQWYEYGAGDPYVFRYNGKYYMYVSTRDLEVGVRAWKSDDLIHWEKCTGEGLKEGYVSEDPITVGAYAPEVYYFNGKFYMYTSPEGHGHYTLEATSPEGPFNVITGNYDMWIDGSVFLDDDESIYFLTGGFNGIEIHEMDSFATPPSDEYESLDKAVMGNWTEGPMMIKYGGNYFLTYTGPDVNSPAYRVSYITAPDGADLLDADDYREGNDNPILLDVDLDNNYKGLGHSSTVLGPDMDSYYIMYHTLNSLTSHGPWRSMGIDRLIFNGSTMSVDNSKFDSVAPTMPEFYAKDTSGSEFETVDGKVLSTSSTGTVFTAEFNFTGNNVKCIVSYTDADNYYYVKADFTEKSVSLHRVSGGTDNTAAAGTLKNNFNPDVLHTIRVAYADGKCDVYFDNMRKIADAPIKLTAGKIGYEGGNAGYTAFSSVARGYSDRRELKQSGANIGASNYLPDGAYKGVTSYKLGSKSGLSTVNVDIDENEEDEKYDGAYKLKLGGKGDFARYSLYFREGGHYGLALTFDKKYCGKKIGVQVNGGDMYTFTIPDVNYDEDDYWGRIVSATVAEFDVEKGENIITLYNAGDEIEFISFTTAPKAYGNFEFINDLKNVVDRGALYSSMFRITSDGHTTRSGNRMLVYFGDGSIADCEMEVRMRFMSENVYGAGIILRAGNYALSNYDTETSIQAYYVDICRGVLSLSKYNYNYTLDKVRFEAVDTSDITNHWFKIKVRFQGNKVSVYLDDKFMFDYVDVHPFMSGYFGLYSNGAEVSYKNLIIRGL